MRWCLRRFAAGFPVGAEGQKVRHDATKRGGSASAQVTLHAPKSAQQGGPVTLDFASVPAVRAGDD